ncbi:MAG: hypothetical protein HY207_11730 [Nitrospirae bacterium]|nr:hypothetical protein [Nitrospirota bacterium]
MKTRSWRPTLTIVLVLALTAVGASRLFSGEPSKDLPDLHRQPETLADEKSEGCRGCHEGIEPMHASPAVKLACVDCHGGNGDAKIATGVERGSDEYEGVKRQAHVAPRFPARWAGPDGRYRAANPEGSYTLLLDESPEFVRFVNPGDLRVAVETCGRCHDDEVAAVRRSTMTTSAIFWGAAGYANGIVSPKRSIFGEGYGRDGTPQLIRPAAPPTAEEKRKGALPFLVPLPRWEIIQPGDNFRAFEDGGLLQPSAFPEIGNPNPLDEPGKPDIRLSSRGLGTGLRVSIPVLNIHKTRLNDPHLSFLGTNDHPGDYRSSGCTACHVVYANDRDPAHSGPYAEFGHLGRSATDDPTISKNESGHPIRHRLTRAVPSSQCMTCHMHQPNSFINTYYGYNLWDYETDGGFLWPAKQQYPTEADRRLILDSNPDGASVRGLWSDPAFLARVSELNPKLQQTQFADYHGHGWIFRAVYKRDRKGNLLDAEDKPVAFEDPKRFEKAVHLADIHMEKGMHCVDCHFTVDSHGNGTLYGEYGHAIEIACEDCHGTTRVRATLRTSGPASPAGGTDLLIKTTPFGRPQFAWREGKLFQRSMLKRDLEWEVVQVLDSITPGNAHYSEKSRLAKTIQRDGKTWGRGDVDDASLAHSNQKMTCYACHSSWMTSCFGCHLPQQANQKSDKHHFESGTTRQYSSYDMQVVRDDVFMLGINGTVEGHKVAPVRSSSAVMLSSTNLNRQRFYIQQPTISAPGFNGQAFNPHVPHTVRARETKGCADCHVSAQNDNNAWMAQLLLLGTKFVNFMGRFAWVAEGEAGLEAVGVTEWEEPQAVLGSFLHRLAYPDAWADHQKRRLELSEAHHHEGGGEARSLVKRGEYLYAALGPKGFEVFDVANVDNKDASERIVTAPVSPLGQRTYVRTSYATAVALPTNMPIAPYRKGLPENEEQAWHPLYHYAYVTDRDEGLIVVNVDTLADRDPTNNFLERAATFNPDGELNGARNLAIAGRYVYVACERGLAVVDIDDPLHPRIAARLHDVARPTSVAIQFRYAFMTDAEGLTVADVTDPRAPRVVARLPIAEAKSVYVSRTYAYVAAGRTGLVIVDVERPDRPRIDQVYTADGRIADARDVKVASTNASLFAYVADGAGGLKVIQLTSPETMPGYLGFSPRPEPRLIATRRTHGPALAVAEGLDRDRAVDESGHQIAVFNRIGARPFRSDEMQRLYLKDGRLYQVENTPPAAPQEPPKADRKGRAGLPTRGER